MGCSEKTTAPKIPDEPYTPDELFTFTLLSNGTYEVTKGPNIAVVNIPEKYAGLYVTTIRDSAFYECSNLTNVTIPNSVTSIGNRAFESCSSLTSITIPNSVTSIGSNAFLRCSSLTSITIGSGVTSIGGYAFYGCSSLTSITVDPANTVYRSEGNCLIIRSINTLTLGCKTSIIPNNVTSIGGEAFFGCSGLTNINIPNSVTYIGATAFARTPSLTSITVDPANIVYRSEGNSIITRSDSTLISGCKTSIIPNSVTSIGGYAFYACSSLISITIPNSVTSIGINAFALCSSLTSIYIPISVTSIGDRVFRSCDILTIYAQATNKPAGWDSNWNPDNRQVVWGATMP